MKPGGRKRTLALLAACMPLGISAQSASGAFTGAGNTATATASQSSYSCSVDYPSMISSTAGLLNYWRLGETSGTTAVDQTGTANGSYVGSPTLGAGAAKPSAMGANTSVSFSALTRHVSIPAGTNDFVGNAPFSVEAWVNPAPASGVNPARTLVGHITTFNNLSGWGLSLATSGSTANKPTLIRQDATSNYDQYQSPVAIPSGQWSHLVGTYDGTRIRLYINGILIGSGLSSRSLSADNVPMFLGRTTNSNSLLGSLDEVAIYNRALSPAEVQAHTANCTYASVVSRTSGLQSYWRLDEASGTSAADSGPNAVTGTYSGSPVRGAMGALPSGTRSSTRFTAGSSQLVTTPSASTFNFAGNAPFSVELWVNPATISSTGVYRRLVSYERLSPTRDAWAVVQTPSNGAIGLERFVNNTGTSVYSANVPVNQWTHVVATYDGTNSRVWLNGVLSNTLSAPASLPAFNNALYIGESTLGSRAFDGSLDEVAIYNRTLTAGEIADHYAAR